MCLHGITSQLGCIQKICYEKLISKLAVELQRYLVFKASYPTDSSYKAMKCFPQSVCIMINEWSLRALENPACSTQHQRGGVGSDDFFRFDWFLSTALFMMYGKPYYIPAFFIVVTYFHLTSRSQWRDLKMISSIDEIFAIAICMSILKSWNQTALNLLQNVY